MVLMLKLKMNDTQKQDSDGKEKKYTREQKVKRLMNMKFENHREYLKALVAIEFEALGVNVEALNNGKEMEEWIKQKKSWLLSEANKENRASTDETNVTITSRPKRCCKGKSLLKEEETNVGTSRSNGCSKGKGKSKKKEKKRRPEKMKNILDEGLNLAQQVEMPQPEMPPELVSAIRERGGINVTWVITKNVYDTDIKKSHNRLSLPGKKVKVEEFLTEEELRKLENVKEFLDVEMVVKSDYEEPRWWWDLNFKKWDMATTCQYVFIKKWWQLAHEHDLHSNDNLQLWSFRLPQDGGELKLCFAMNVVRKNKNGGSTSKCSTSIVEGHGASTSTTGEVGDGASTSGGIRDGASTSTSGGVGYGASTSGGLMEEMEEPAPMEH